MYDTLAEWLRRQTRIPRTFDICFIRERRFKSCRCRFFFLFGFLDFAVEGREEGDGSGDGSGVENLLGFGMAWHGVNSLLLPSPRATIYQRVLYPFRMLLTHKPLGKGRSWERADERWGWVTMGEAC